MPQFDQLNAWIDWLSDTAHHSRSSLSRTSRLKDKLGIKPLSGTVITVTGTNGKGSYVNALTALLLAKGKTVGSYYSPHLIKFNERIQLDGQDITDKDLLSAFNAVGRAADAEGEPLHFFELLTLTALSFFNDHQPDYWVLEVGIGGRKDAVNAMDADVAVITSIGLDHAAYLGNTRASVAFEKCGILRPNTVLISAESNPPEPLQAAITHHDALVIDQDFSVSFDETWQFTDKRLGYELALPDTGLSPFSQAAAIMTATHVLDLNFSSSELIQALATGRLTGRFERFTYKGIRYVVDATHNLQAAEFLKQRLMTLPKPKRRLAVFSFLNDKAYSDMLTCLQSEVDAWFIGQLNVERAADAPIIAKTLHEAGEYMISVSKNMRQALSRAEQLADEGDEILIFGSFRVISDLLPKIKKQQGL